MLDKEEFMGQAVKKWDGPIYDLMRAYSQLTYGNRFPRVVAGYAARKWVHQYARKHSLFPHCEDRYGQTLIERGDVPEDTFKFFLDDDIRDGIMNSYHERQCHVFSDSYATPPNLEPISVKIPIEDLKS
jgi:hypothetical protein